MRTRSFVRDQSQGARLLALDRFDKLLSDNLPEWVGHHSLRGPVRPHGGYSLCLPQESGS